MSQVVIDGETFDVPDENDWELGELAEFVRLRDKWGGLGATIGIVWIVKHRADPTFTVDQAERIKVGALEEIEVEDDALPLDSAPGNGKALQTPESPNGPPATPEGSGPLKSGGQPA